MDRIMLHKFIGLFTEEGRWRLVPVSISLCGLAFVVIGLNIFTGAKVGLEYIVGILLTTAGLAVCLLMADIFFVDYPEVKDISQESTTELVRENSIIPLDEAVSRVQV